MGANIDEQPPFPAPPAEPARALSIRRHDAVAGLRWVHAGLRLFARQPLGLIVTIGLAPLGLGTLQALLPVLGALLGTLLAPAISVGMLNVCRCVRDGSPPSLRCYAAALSPASSRRRLLQLGAYYAAYAGLMTLIIGLDGGQTAQVARSSGVTAAAAPVAAVLGRAPPGPAPAAAEAKAAAAAGLAPNPVPNGAAGTGSPAPAQGTQQQTAEGYRAARPAAAAGPADSGRLAADAPRPAPSWPALVLLLGLTLLFSMTAWYAPVLSAWYQMPASKALYFSFFSCWRNRTPMLVALFSLLGFWVVGVFFVAALIDLVDATQGWAPYLMLAPLALITMAVGQATNLALLEDVIDDKGDSYAG